jgi:hypothetical protein
MSKDEIKADLKARGLFDKTGNRDVAWLKAFELYQKETKRRLSPSCGSCYNTLRTWMNS